MTMRSLMGIDTIQQETGLLSGLVFVGNIDPDRPIEAMLDYSTHTVAYLDALPLTVIVLNVQTTRDKTVNYCGLAGHTIPDGAMVQLWDAPLATMIAENPVTGPGPQFIEFAPGLTSTEFNIVITNINQPIEIGSFYLGSSFELTQGFEAPWTPPAISREVTHFPSVSNKGANYLGSHVHRTGVAFDISQRFYDPAVMGFLWNGLRPKLEQFPFFLSANHDVRPQDCVYAWAEKIRPPFYHTPLHMGWGMQCRGIHVA